MARMKVEWKGLRELRVSLQTMSTDLAEAAAPYVGRAATQTRDRVLEAYRPFRITGRLEAGVKLTEQRTTSNAIVGFKVRTGAKHAHLFELGTVRSRPANIFIPIRNQERRTLFDNLTRHVLPHFNLQVRGSFDAE